MGKTYRKFKNKHSRDNLQKCRGCFQDCDSESLILGLCEGCQDDEQEHLSSYDPAGGDEYYFECFDE